MGTWMEERKISMSEDKKLEDTELEKKETEEKDEYRENLFSLPQAGE